MILQSWKSVLYFKPWEFDDPSIPDSGQHINALLVMLLDKLRMIIDTPIITHWQAGGCVDMNGTHGHAPNSYHRYDQGARACDFHIKTNTMNVREQFNYIAQAGFSGVGIYLYSAHQVWFHVDTRPRNKTQYWTCKRPGQYDYLL